MAETIGGASGGGAAGSGGGPGLVNGNNGETLDDDFNRLVLKGGSGGIFNGNPGESDPFGFGGGAGGQGGANGAIVTSAVPSIGGPITGGNGGAGGNGEENGGGGGAGGYGILLRAAVPLDILSSARISGGNGGGGGRGANGNGQAGVGGGGIFVSGNGTTNVTITNAGFIAAGNGSFGGDGIRGAYLTIVNSGTIAGGTSGVPGDAVVFTGGTNTFEFQGGTVTGNVVANGTNDTFLLGGSTGGNFDVSNIGTSAEYRGFEKLGSTSSTWILTGTNNSTQSWTASGGTIGVFGSMANTAFTIASGASLAGTGTVGAVTVQSGGVLAPGTSPGILHSGNFSLESGALLEIQIFGTEAGVNGYDQVAVTGTVTLGGALDVDVLNPFVPAFGNTFKIIDNDGTSDIVLGTFTGYNEGAIVTAGGKDFRISYRGGDGNDVTLSTLSPAPTLNKNTGLTLAEGGSKLILASSLGYSDADQTDANLVYKITLETAGTVVKNSTDLAVGQTFTQADIDGGLISFRHDGSETKASGFGFELSDQQGNTISSSFAITVTPVNDAPTGAPTAVLVNGFEDTNYTVSAADLLLGFSDAENDKLSVAGLSTSNGSVKDNGDGTYTISPALNFNGGVTLTYGVTDGDKTLTGQTRSFNLAAVNDAPTGAPTASLANGVEDTKYTVAISELLKGFSDVDSPLSVDKLVATHGALVKSGSKGDDTYTFTPDLNYNGLVTLTYDVTDGDKSITGQTRTFTLTATNDRATISGAKAGAVAEDGTLVTSGKLTVSDVDTGEAKFATPASLAGTYGTFTVNAAGDWGYTLANASSKVQALKGGQIVTDTLQVKSFDGTAAETITVSITGKNDAPAGAPSKVLASGTEDTKYTFTTADLLKGFSDIDGDTLSVTGLKSSNGPLVDNKNGTYTLTPATNYNGAVTLSYGVSDGKATLANQSRSFTLAAVDDAPTAVVLSNIHAPLPETTSTTPAIKVADITITDLDGGNNVLSLTGLDAAMFSIVGSGLYLNAGALLDFETNPSLDVTVNARPSGGAISASKAFKIAVTDMPEAVPGTPNADNLTGNPWAETLDGAGGDDTINGGGGDDTIIGGLGRDILTGGEGKDVFTFGALDSAVGASGYINNGPLNPLSGAPLRDVITDFTPGFDLIDLLAIDAVSAVPNDQAFTFKGLGSFAAAGDLIYRQFDAFGTIDDKTIIYGDTNGDRAADFQIELTGLKTLTAADFRL